jgi:hypothetical protein
MIWDDVGFHQLMCLGFFVGRRLLELELMQAAWQCQPFKPAGGATAVTIETPPHVTSNWVNETPSVVHAKAEIPRQ